MPLLSTLTELSLLAVSVLAALGMARWLASPAMTVSAFLIVNLTARFALSGWPLFWPQVIVALTAGVGLGVAVRSQLLGYVAFAAVFLSLVIEAVRPGVVVGFHGVGDVVALVLAAAVAAIILRAEGRRDRALLAGVCALALCHMGAALPHGFPAWQGPLAEGAILLAGVGAGWAVWRLAGDAVATVLSGLSAILVLQVAATIPLESLFADGEVGKAIRTATNEFVRSLVINYGDAFEAFSDTLLQALVQLERVLEDIPAMVVIALVGLLALAVSRRAGLAVAMAAALWFVGALGLWAQAMQTVAIMLVAMGLAIVIGIPVGVITAKSDATRGVVNPVLDLMQTIPSFVYLIPAVMLFGLGKIPAVLATVIYATPPLIRLTDLGIRYVDAEVVEASRAFGANRWQLLTGVQIPLAMPSIMQGINQTMMMALAMVVIASMIGARGVGETVLLGLQRNDAGQGLIGGIAIVILAIIFDRISQAAGARARTFRSAGE